MANLYSYNTGTARKLDSTDFNYGPNLRREIEKEVNLVKKARPTKTKAKAHRGIKGIVAVTLMFAMAFSVVSGYVAINEAENEISELRDEYNSIVASNQSIQVRIDRAIDLKQLQTIAGERYGMVSPERYQMFYVDLGMEDYAESASLREQKEKQQRVTISGVPGIITGTLNIFR